MEQWKVGRTMSGQHVNEEPQDNDADAPEDHGRYVEGAYGKAGAEAGHHVADAHGRYVEGDYGATGTEDASTSEASGRFVEADYGTAGDVPGHADKDPKGDYVTGDYGDAPKSGKKED
ncbi:hypothetical protein [Arthrobacter sp. ERGS1:01]|uniref:hypothetical protein n=1 Tax=Arthrobacter sp. ERGS1:01 TaxID=1704044 RepID=UPI000AD3C2EF|nr:hypothetical protein [Arthrobacter sp. ERGS1:01]